MSARPALALVTTTPHRAGRAALQFIQWAVDTFGEPGPQPGLVVVRRSQTALVAEHETIRSDGTVTRYMRQLREAGVVTGGRPIAVDVDALADAAGDRLRADRAVSPIPASGSGADALPARPPTPTVAELLARRAEQQARLAVLQAELALTDVTIARTLGDTEPADSDPGARDLANRALANRDRFREFRDPEVAIQEGRKGYLDNPPSFLTSDVANRDRETREPSRSRDPLPTAGAALTYDEVDEILEPLRSWCRANGRVDHLDDVGRQNLARLGRGQLAAGVDNILRETVADPAIRKPIGLLIDRARKGHADTFQANVHLGPGSSSTPAERPPATRAANSGSVTANAVTPTFEPPSRQAIDADVIELAASPAGLAAARRSITTLLATSKTTGQETRS